MNPRYQIGKEKSLEVLKKCREPALLVMRQQRSQTRAMRAQFSTQRKSLPHPRSALGKESGSRGCWATWEAGNTVALGSRSAELLAETRLQAERGEEVLWPHSQPAHRPPASASHWVNLTGGQMSQETCTRSLQGWAPQLQRRGKAQSRQQAYRPGPA